jgi:phage terminase large subunit GpA-like protein
MSVATNSDRRKHQKREIKDFNSSKELFSTEQDFSDFSTVHFSLSEYDAIRLKDRIPAIEVVEFIRFKSENNYSDRIDLTLTPYLRLIIECIGKKGIYWLICIAPTQSGKTTVLQVFVADHMDQKGGYFFYIMPTGRTAVRAFQDKVTDMVEATPRLLEHVLTPHHENMTNFVIRLDNSSVFPVTCGSLAEMSGMTTSGMAIDEIRLMPLDTLDESNVVHKVKIE